MTKKTKFIILIALSATAIILSMVLCALKETNFSFSENRHRFKPLQTIGAS